MRCSRGNNERRQQVAVCEGGSTVASSVQMQFARGMSYGIGSRLEASFNGYACPSHWFSKVTASSGAGGQAGADATTAW